MKLLKFIILKGDCRAHNALSEIAIVYSLFIGLSEYMTNGIVNYRIA